MATVVSQDDLHDAIQDADFIGAVCDPSPKPTQALQLMSVDEAEMVARHMPLEFEGVLTEPLGYFLVRVVLCGLWGESGSQTAV